MIESKIIDGVTVLTMAHGKANALDLEFCDALAACFQDLRKDGTKAVVLTGQGKIFSAGVDLKRVQLLGTGLWGDDTRIASEKLLEGGWYPSPEQTGFRNFSARYRARYGQDPVRTATLAYDAVAVVAALVKTQGTQRFSEQVLANPSGFAGIDGVFRFRAEGTNDRGLAVLRVTPSGGQVISPAPKSFAPGT